MAATDTTEAAGIYRRLGCWENYSVSLQLWPQNAINICNKGKWRYENIVDFTLQLPKSRLVWRLLALSIKLLCQNRLHFLLEYPEVWGLEANANCVVSGSWRLSMQTSAATERRTRYSFWRKQEGNKALNTIHTDSPERTSNSSRPMNSFWGCGSLEKKISRNCKGELYHPVVLTL